MTTKNISIGIGLVVLIIAAWFALKQGQGVALAPAGSERYSSEELGFAFTYPTGKGGYVLREYATPTAEVGDLVRQIGLERSEDAAQTPPKDGEGPAMLSIVVFRNSANEWSRQWAENHPQYSNYGLKRGEVEELVVGGANAVRYSRDGLYQGDVVVVAHGGFVYVFDGAYDKPSSPNRAALDALVSSVTFIPSGEDGGAPPMSGKLNINTVCEGALAYMTFPSGAEADAFVADCKVGNRPEVIEKYKKDNGLDGATI